MDTTTITLYNLEGFTPEVQAIALRYLETSTGGSLDQFEAAQEKFYADMEAAGVGDDVLYALEMALGM